MTFQAIIVSSQSLTPSNYFKPEIIREKQVKKAIVPVIDDFDNIVFEEYLFDTLGNFTGFSINQDTNRRISLKYNHKIISSVENSIDAQKTIQWKYDSTGNLLEKRIYLNDTLSSIFYFSYLANGKINRVIEKDTTGKSLRGSIYSYSTEGILISVNYTGIGLSRTDYTYKRRKIITHLYSDSTTLKMLKVIQLNRKGLIIKKTVFVPEYIGFLLTRYRYSAGLLRKIRHTNGWVSKVRYQYY